jgi:hypothetical protein
MFAEVRGVKTTLPFGDKTPAAKRSRPDPAIGPTLDAVNNVGLTTQMFGESRGTQITFPFGAKTPP